MPSRSGFGWPIEVSGACFEDDGVLPDGIDPLTISFLMVFDSSAGFCTGTSKV